MKIKSMFKEMIIACILIVLIIIWLINKYLQYKELHPVKVNMVPVVEQEDHFTKSTDFYNDTLLSEEKKFYYDHLYNTTEE